MIEFEWDDKKNKENKKKHNVSFELASIAFEDPHAIYYTDEKHSTASETRFYCFGKVGYGIVTVRFTKRSNKIRIFGAGYWREGKNIYEKENKE